MGRVSARIDLPVPAGEAQSAWLDVARWPLFVDGLRRVVRVDGPWPAAGAVVEWDSHAGGRGRVVERVVSYGQASEQVLDVEDEGVTGRQTVAFAAIDGGVRITLSLAYTVRSRSPLTPLVDVLFIRRSQRESLERTLLRFGQELTTAR